MTTSGWLQLRKAAIGGMMLGLAACQAVPNARVVAVGGDDERRAAAAMAHWPRASVEGIHRTFEATVHLAGIKAESPGTFDYYGPRDFRILAERPGKEVLFDARMNWAGVAVMRIKNTLPQSAVEMVTADIAQAFVLPMGLEGLKAGEEKMVLEQRRGDGNRYRWIFNRSDGALVQMDVDLGLLDTLHIYFRGGHTAAGWPREVEFSRPARLYDLALRFTD